MPSQFTSERVSVRNPHPLNFLVGGGEMGERTRAFDWSQTPVGSAADWPQSLKTAVSICLGSRYPTVIWWGNPAYTMFYNDAYISFLGATKHPGWLGRSGRECWREIWPTIGPLLEGVFSTGEATWSEDLLLVLDRNLPREEGYFTFSYSAVRDDVGSVGGVFCACYETTGRVIGERRLRTLRDLSRMVMEAKAAEQACEVAAKTLAGNRADIPFALIYLLDAEASHARLMATSGLDAGTSSAPYQIDMNERAESPATWPLRRVFDTAAAELITGLAARCGPLPGGPWPESPEAALILPIASPGESRSTGFLVAGLSPRRIVDADYRSFFDLIVGHIGTAIANARAYAEERRRAEVLAELDRAKTTFFSNVTLPEGRHGLVCYFRDISERVQARNETEQLVADLHDSRRAALNLMEDALQAKEALRESEERFRMVADNMDQLAWTCDTLGNVTWYNRRWLAYTGLTFEEMKGWNWSKVQHPDHLDRVVERVRQSAETGEPWQDTFPLRGGSGEYRWFLSRALPIRDEQGNILRWFGTNTDVTEQLAAEEALREANRRKDEFLATLAHELRNPLAPIRTGLELIRVSGDTPQSVARVRSTMERQIGHMVRLIDDLLDVSRITSGKIQLQRRPTALAELVNNAVEANRAAATAGQLEITATVPDLPLHIDVDPTRFVQILSNVVHNATKFTPPGGRIAVVADIVGEASASDEQLLLIKVADTGVGISEEMLPRVFDLFTQVEPSEQRSQPGLGIGLALARQLIELHGGRIEARSEGLNLGSEFIISLPLKGSLVLEAVPAVRGKTARKVTRRVVIIDDNEDAARITAMLIEELGGEARVAFDAIEGIQATREFRPDVVLLDIGMPGIDGYEACRRIRGTCGTNVLIVALTGWGQETDKQEAVAAGFDAHLTKPADPAALEAILLMERQPGRISN